MDATNGIIEKLMQSDIDDATLGKVLRALSADAKTVTATASATKTAAPVAPVQIPLLAAVMPRTRGSVVHGKYLPGAEYAPYLAKLRELVGRMGGKFEGTIRDIEGLCGRPEGKKRMNGLGSVLYEIQVRGTHVGLAVEDISTPGERRGNKVYRIIAT